MFRPVLVSVVALALHVPCHADSVFGIEMGKKIELPECPYKTYGGSKFKNYDVMPKITCVTDAHPLNGYKVNPREVVFSQDEAPPIVRNWTMFVLEIDEKAEGFHFLTNGISTQNEVLALLTKKFGRPTSLTHHSVVTATSSPLDSIDATWDLPAVQVIFWGSINRIDRGEVMIDSAPAAALRKSWLADTKTKERSL